MTERNCQIVSKEKLVAYVDGELPPSQAEKVVEHITECDSCRTMLSALDRSLQVARVIWQTNEAQWPKTHSFAKPQSNRWSVIKIAAVAASILLVLGVGLTWRILSGPSEQPHVIGKEPTAIEIEVAANHAALAAQKLAVADMYATKPDGEKYAVQRYTDLIKSFSGSMESVQAKLRLQKLLERTVQ